VFKPEESKELTATVGTCYYVAPEVLEAKYGFSCDCWSLGVILYAMLSNHLPFPGATNSEVFRKIKTL
jgi:serine/threonine protein kinase